MRPVGGVGAGVFDVQAGTAVPFAPAENRFCNGPLILGDGRLVFVGGDVPPGGGIGDGRQTVGVYDPAGPAITTVNTMLYPRWYATPCRMPDGKVLLVGGTEFCDYGARPPVAELWDPAAPVGTPNIPAPMPPTFQAAAGDNWYPFIQLLPKGDILWFADTAGSITDAAFNLLRDLPPLPASWPYRTMYPNTATISLLPLGPANGYAPSFVIFGGADPAVGPLVPAAPTSLRLDLVPCTTDPSGYCTEGWIAEDKLGHRHVMGDTTLLPNGKVMLYGGAKAGHARLIDGSGNPASGPNTVPLLYDSYAPRSARYAEMDATNIARSYHSATCLHPTGEVLVAGCDSCDLWVNAPAGLSASPDAPYEYRLELATPSDIGPGANRPSILSAPAVIARGGTFTVTFAPGPGGGALTGASLAAPCATTHSMGINQRVVMMEVVQQDGSTATIAAPPGPPAFPGLALPGRWLLFLLGPGRTYSTGVWVTLQ